MALPTFTTAQIIRQLRTEGANGDGTTHSWVAQPVVYYSIDNTLTSFGSESSYAYDMTPKMEGMAAAAFELWDDVMGISLNRVSSGGDILFDYATSTKSGGTYAYSGPLTAGGTNIYGTTNFDMQRSEIWINSKWTSHDADADMVYGGYGLLTFIHEIGHSLGLSHPGSYDAFHGSPTYVASAEFAQDTRAYTAMSYFNADEDGSATDHRGVGNARMYAATPLLYDIAAIQAIYGADMTTRTGSTVYGFNATAANAVYDFRQNLNAIFCIWDAGGTDTIDASGYSTNQMINLNAGTFSNVGNMSRNISIAFNVTIENAVGGSGSDNLYGNSVANVLDGRAGSDTAILTGTQASYAFSGTTTNLRATAAGITDTLLNVEFVRFGTGASVAVSTLLGGSLADDFRDSITDLSASLGALTMGSKKAGIIETASDRDIFSVSLTAGQTYTFDLTKVALANPYLRLLNANGTQVATNDNVSAISVNSKIQFTATTSGTYYLEARDAAAGTGTYNVSATKVVIPADDYRDAIADITAPVGLLSVGSYKSGSIEVAGDKDIFSISLAAGSTYAFNMNGSALDPYLRLMNSTGSVLASNNDVSATSHNSLIVFRAASSGTYYLETGGFSTGDKGSYTIAVVPKFSATAADHFEIDTHQAYPDSAFDYSL